jgi:hypothetical protein
MNFVVPWSRHPRITCHLTCPTTLETAAAHDIHDASQGLTATGYAKPQHARASRGALRLRTASEPVKLVDGRGAEDIRVRSECGGSDVSTPTDLAGLVLWL